MLRTAPFLICVILSSASLADTPVAIMGGASEGVDSFATAYTISEDGTLTALSGAGFPPVDGQIYRVAIADSGAGIIGGQSGAGADPPIAYLVAPNGTLTALSGAGFPQSDGVVLEVAIAENGIGLIGGRSYVGDQPPFAYFVAPNGALTALSGDGFPQATGRIVGVAIASNGTGILGGENEVDGSFPIAYRVTPSKTLIALSGGDFPETSGSIDAVAIAETGVGIIGGQGNGAPTAYFVAPNGTLRALSGAGFPQTEGFIDAVAIAENGAAIIGGQSLVSPDPPIAYLVAPNGTLRALSGAGFPQTSGIVNSVAIANSGAAIIGGQDDSGGEPPFAYLVAPNGTLRALSGAGFPQASGYINRVAIAESGAGIIGGQSLVGSNPPIAYLVAPNGTLTALSGAGFPQTEGAILGVAIAPGLGLTPTSFGPYSSLANTLFTLSHVFESHCTGRKKALSNPSSSKTTMLADSILKTQRLEISQNSELGADIENGELEIAKEACPISMEKYRPSWTAWSSFFGALAYQDREQNIPTFSNKIAGALASLEYDRLQNMTVGGGLAYAFTYVHYAASLGHAALNQEYAFAYVEINKPCVYFNAALFGGLYQMHNKRYTLGFITSTSSPNGWLLSPHVELGAPFTRCVKGLSLMVDPFVMFDWANSWQGTFREHGSSGLNITLGSQYSSILRSEVGVRLYETLEYDWGCFKIEEKGSYVNKAPFHTGAGTAFFVGAIYPFSVESFSSSIQNLGIAQIAFYFTPWNTKYPYGSLDYQGEFGASFQSHILVLEIGKAF